MNINELVKALVDAGNTEHDAWICKEVIETLMETHAIVPRDIPYETLAEIKSKTPETVRKMLNLFIEISER